MEKGLLDLIAYILVIIGAINWGLYAFASMDLVALIFTPIMPELGLLVYGLVALSGLYILYAYFMKQ